MSDNKPTINISEVKRLAGIDPNTYKPVEFMQPAFMPPAMHRRRWLAEAASTVLTDSSTAAHTVTGTGSPTWHTA